MTIETLLLTAFVAAAGAVLIAVIGLIASVHYRLGKLEEGQKTLAQEDANTREMVAQGNTHDPGIDCPNSRDDSPGKTPKPGNRSPKYGRWQHRETLKLGN